MARVRSTEVAFEFPLLIVNSKGERWTCRDLNDLMRGSSEHIQSGRFLELNITDASGRRWVSRGFHMVGRMERWKLSHILSGNSSDWRLDYELRELPRVARTGVGAADGLSGVPPESYETAPSSETPGGNAFDTDFAFPMVGFAQNHGMLCYSDLSALTHASWVYLRDETLIGMELIDNRMRRWIVRSVEPMRPPRVQRWWHFGPDTSVVEFDLGLDEIEATTFPELKRRVLDELELDDPDDQKAVRRARNLAAMFKAAYEQGTGLL